MLNAVRTTSPSAKPAAPVAKPAAQASESTLVRDSVAFRPMPVAQASNKKLTITLPTFPQAVGGTVAGVAVAGATFLMSLGMGMGGAGAIANLVALGGFFVATPAAAYFGGKLAGMGWDALTKK